MRETDKAYVAGFFDADGCVSINGAHLRLLVNISQGRRGILEEISELFGGSIGEFQAKNTHYVWYLSGKRAQEFLTIVHPYLKVKKVQADIALEFPVGAHGKRVSDSTLEARRALSVLMKGVKEM